MFALLALFVAGAAAAPQVPLQYQYPLYPQYQQYYYPQPQLRYVPQYPVGAYQNPAQAYPVQAYPVQAEQAARGIFGLDLPIVGFQSQQANFVTDGSTQVIQGSVEFKQNVFTGANSDYIIYMKEAGTLKMAGNGYSIYISDDCTTTSASPSNAIKLTDITAPQWMVNGFYAKGNTGDYNIDGTSSKTSVNGKRIVVVSTSATTTVLGCSAPIA